MAYRRTHVGKIGTKLRSFKPELVLLIVVRSALIGSLDECSAESHVAAGRMEGKSGTWSESCCGGGTMLLVLDDVALAANTIGLSASFELVFRGSEVPPHLCQFQREGSTRRRKEKMKGNFNRRRRHMVCRRRNNITGGKWEAIIVSSTCLDGRAL